MLSACETFTGTLQGAEEKSRDRSRGAFWPPHDFPKNSAQYQSLQAARWSEQHLLEAFVSRALVAASELPRRSQTQHEAGI